MSINKSIARSASVISIATLCSRVLGFARDMVIARLFGVYLYAEAFVVAFRIPNLFRDLAGEGAVNAAVVPVLSEYAATRSKEEFWELANALMNAALVILMAFTLLGMVFSPVLVRLIAPGFASDPVKLATTISLNRIIFPYILLIGLAAYTMGVLNSLKHFAVPAFAPCLLNISIIICAMLFGEGIKGLASGVLIGGVLQLAVQVPVLYRKGFVARLRNGFTHPAVRSIGKLLVPRMASSGIYQLNNFVDSIFASFAIVVGEGAVAVLYFAYRLIQFPLGVFSTSLSQALLPTLSSQALEPTHERLSRTFSFGMRATFFVLLPASVGFIAAGRLIVETLFAGGKFDAYSVEQTSRVLACYSIGLCAYGANRVLQFCFFALKDTATPTKVAGIGLVLSIALNLAFIFPLKVAGIALAAACSGIVSCGLLGFFLSKKLRMFSWRSLARSFFKILVASILAGVCCGVLAGAALAYANTGWVRWLCLGGVLVATIAAYLFWCRVCSVKEAQELWAWIRSHGKR